MIGIICAMDIEVAGIKAVMTDVTEETIAGTCFWHGKINGKECVCAECGIGKVNAAICTQTMIIKYAPFAIINSGIAGALKSGMEIGDIVVGISLVEHDMDLTAFGDALGTVQFSDCKIKNFLCDEDLASSIVEACRGLNCKVYTGIIVSGDQFISGQEKRHQLHKEFNAIACEMEGAAIGHVCNRNNIPYCVLRSISDNLDKDEYVDFLEFKKQSADNATKILIKLLSFI